MTDGSVVVVWLLIDLNVFSGNRHEAILQQIPKKPWSNLAVHVTRRGTRRAPLLVDLLPTL